MTVIPLVMTVISLVSLSDVHLSDDGLIPLVSLSDVVLQITRLAFSAADLWHFKAGRMSCIFRHVMYAIEIELSHYNTAVAVLKVATATYSPMLRGVVGRGVVGTTPSY